MHDMRLRFIGCAMATGVVFGLMPGAVRAQQMSGVDAALQRELAALSEKHHGKVALYATQLNTGKSVAIDADEPVQTASVIKLTILFEAMEQVRAGKARWDEKITLAKGDGVSANWTGDKTRDRCIELLYDALALDSGARASAIYSAALVL